MSDLVVETPTGFRFRSTLLSHGWIDLAPFSYDEAYTRLGRTHRLDNGRIIRFTVREGESCELVIEFGDQQLNPEEMDDLKSAVGRIFQLGLDLTAFYDALRTEDRYRWVEQLGAGRLLRSPTVWEDLVKTLLTTNTTWAMTRSMVRRVTSLGDPLSPGQDASAIAGPSTEDREPPSGTAEASKEDVRPHAFPRPEQVAALPLDELDRRVRAGYRSGYLHELAQKIVDGEIDVESWAATDLPADELYARIKSLNGFGPYAAGAVLKLLGKFDRLALDSAARSMFAREFSGGERPLDSTISDHYTRFGEWRGLVMWMDLMGGYLREHT